MRLTLGFSIVFLAVFFYPFADAAVLIGIEAEQADKLEPLMEVQEDPDASGGKFILTPGNNAPRNQGWALYNIEIPETNEYIVWGRTLSPSGGQNSFYITFDVDEFVPNGQFAWGTPEAPNWVWNLANWTNAPNSPPQIFKLSAGKHELKIWAREAGTQIDGMYITNDQKLQADDLPMPIEVPPPKNVQHIGKLASTWARIKMQ